MIREIFQKDSKLKYLKCSDPYIRWDGYYQMTDNSYFPHFTVKDTAMNPAGWEDFEICLGYRRFDESAVLSLCFGKPYANDKNETAKIRIVLTTQSITVTVPEGKGCTEVQMKAEFVPVGDIRIWSKEGILMINTYEIPVVKLSDLYGYMEFYCEKGWFYLSDFTAESHMEPYTLEQHKKRIMEWRDSVQDKIDENLDKLENYLKEHSDILPTKSGDLIVSKRLVDKGEEITIDVVCYGAPNAALMITENCFGMDAQPVPYVLALRKEGENYCQRIQLKCQTAGNLKLELWVNGEKLIRQVAVLDKGYMAVIPWIGNNIPVLDEEIHKYDIAGDCVMGDYVFLQNGEMDFQGILNKIIPYVKNHHKYGDRSVVWADAHYLLPGSETESLFELDYASQKRGFKQLERMMHIFGYEEIELLGSYTADAAAMEILEEMGVKGLTSLCVWQNYKDGGGKINHCGITSQPFYPSKDDFRCPGEPRKFMCFTMGNSSCCRNYSIMAFEGCPTNVVPGERYLEHRVIHHSAQRYYDAFDGYLADLKNNDQLMTVTIGIENFFGLMDSSVMNEMAIRYLVKKAATEKMVFTSAADVSEYHQRKHLRMQEAYFYQPDIYYGYHNGELPGNIGDRIEAETHDYLAVVRRGYTLPMYFYDYTKPWENIPWDETAVYNEFGLINPDKHAPSECIPRQVYREDMTIDTQMEGDKIKICIQSETAKERMVTGVFDVPFEEDFTAIADKPDVKIKKIADCWTGNTHLFVDLGSLDSGKTEIVISLSGTPRIPEKSEYIKDELGVMWFKDHAYMRCTGREQAIHVSMDAPEGAYIVFLDGNKLYPTDGKWEFIINEEWFNETPMLWGCDKEAFAKAMDNARVTVIGPTKCSRWSW